MTCGVYLLRRNDNPHQVYIGSSKHIEKRYKKHIYELKSCKHNNQRLQHLYNKYEDSKFILQILQECRVENLILIEQEYVSYYVDMYGRENLLNTSVVIANPMFDKSVMDKHSEIIKQYWTIPGKREEQSDRMKNLWNDEFKGKVRLTLKDRYNDPEYLAKYKSKCKDISTKRYKEDPEWAAKFRKGAIEYNSKKVICLELNMEFSSIAEAFRTLKDILPRLSESGISSSCRGTYVCCGGMHWVYSAKFNRNESEAKAIIDIKPRPLAKKIKCVQTGEIFESVIYAAKSLGEDSYKVRCASILRSCSTHYLAYGYKWEFYET